MSRFLIYQIVNKQNSKAVREKANFVKSYTEGNIEMLEEIRKMFIKLPPDDLYKHVSTVSAVSLQIAENISSDLKSENLTNESEYEDEARGLDIGDILKPPKGTIAYVKHRSGFDKMDTLVDQTKVVS